MINLVRRVRINDRIPAMWYNDKLIRTAYRKETLIVGEYEYYPDPTPYATKYFCIESLEDSNTITFTKTNNVENLNNIYYTSTDLNTWTEYYGTNSWILNAGQKLYFKAVANTWFDYLGGGTSSVGYRFSANKYYNVAGNIMSLLYGDDFAGQTEINYGTAFCELFYDSNKLVSASNLVLPATTLSAGCYLRMFEYCTSLVATPTLPATTLINICYENMFSGCTSLTTAPNLPATTLAIGCYSHMFDGCTSLSNVPLTLPATKFINTCYASMFKNCVSLVTAPDIAATSFADNATGCCIGMFEGCTSLVTAPDLLATVVTSQSYYQMFKNCTKLNYIKCMVRRPDSSYNGGFYEWVQNVASSGTFVKNPSASWSTGDSGIPSGWTVQDAA